MEQEMFDRWPELGPVTIRIDELEGVPSMQVEVDRDADRAATALRWINGPLEPVDATLGTFGSDRSHEWWLNVRGWVPAGDQRLPAVLSIPYVEGKDAVELASIRERIEEQDVLGMVAALSAAEMVRYLHGGTREDLVEEVLRGTDDR